MAGIIEAQPPPSKTVRLTAGSTISTSGAYVWCVAIARAINKFAPGINVTVVESGATYDNIRRIREGMFDLGLPDGWAGLLEMHRGLETFEKSRWEPIRFLLFREPAASRTYVRAESGIKTWADLKGRTIGSGTPGSAVAMRVVRCNEVLGTGVKFFPGTLTEAARDLQNGRIEAVHKSGPVESFDAALQETHLLAPLNVIGFSDAEAEKIKAKYPQFLIRKTPAGAIKTLPRLPGVWEIYSISGVSTSSRLSQDIGYRIVKAIHEHWKEISQAYPSCAPYHPIEDYIKIVPQGMEVPFHAGVVQYAKEIGIKIPNDLIPPEYKQR